MGCFCDNTDHTHDDKTQGPKHREKCTDVLFLVFYLMFLCGMIGVAVVSLQYGSVMSLVYAKDYKGRLCGQEEGVLDKPVGTYPNLASDLATATAAGWNPSNPATWDKLELYTVCRESCPRPGDTVTNDEGEVSTFEYNTTKILYRCIETEGPSADTVKGLFNGTSAKAGKYFGDLWAAKKTVFTIGVLVSTVLSFIVIFSMKIIATVVIYLVILLSHVVVLAATGLCFVKSGSVKAPSSIGEYVSPANDETQAQIYLYFGIGGAILFVVMLILVIALRKKIATAIAIIKTSSQVIKDIPLLVFYPITSVIALVLLYLYFMFIGAELMTAEVKVGDLTKVINSTTNNYTASIAKYEDYDAKTGLLLYHLFGFLWTQSFIQGASIMVMAGAVTQWYFSREKNQSHEILSSFKRTFRYNLGSVAIGSFLIAIVQFIQWIFRFLEARAKALGKKDNQAAKIAKACIACCLWCFEKCLKFLNKNAYIYTSFTGVGFFSGACAATKLIILNIAQVGTLNACGEGVVFFGKVMVSGLAGLFTFAWLDNDAAFSAEHSSWLPVGTTMFLAYFVSSMFFYVYDLVIDSILLCFLWESANVSDGYHFWSDDLAALVNENTEADHATGKDMAGV